nr:hypothetical protein CFP56_56786 [Quercus suber]
MLKVKDRRQSKEHEDRLPVESSSFETVILLKPGGTILFIRILSLLLEKQISQLKRLNLSGVLPVDFGNLTNLQELDLGFNYISGSLVRALRHPR